MKYKADKLVLKMVYTALFTALTFAATYINIKFSIGGMIHLGNFVAVLAALLFGGIVGGISGSLGMGLFDLINGYPITTWLRTFIVKFVFCFVIGVLFRVLIKKENNDKKLSLILFIVFTLISGTVLTIYLVSYKEAIMLVLSIVLFVFSLLCLVMFILSNKINYVLNSALFASSIGILINVILEFILRIALMMLLSGQNFESSLSASIIKIPSALFNGVITIVFVSIVFIPIYMATKNINKLNKN